MWSFQKLLNCRPLKMLLLEFQQELDELSTLCLFLNFYIVSPVVMEKI